VSNFEAVVVLLKGMMCLFVHLNDIDMDHWLFTDFLHHVMHRLYNLNTAVSWKYRGGHILIGRRPEYNFLLGDVRCASTKYVGCYNERGMIMTSHVADCMSRAITPSL